MKHMFAGRVVALTSAALLVISFVTASKVAFAAGLVLLLLSIALVFFIGDDDINLG